MNILPGLCKYVAIRPQILYARGCVRMCGLTMNIRLNAFNSIPRYSRCIKTTSKNFVDVKVPTFPESVSQADLRWSKYEGDKVTTDEVIGELETDKTTLQILAPCDGVITKFYFKDNDKVTSTDVVCDISPSPQQQQQQPVINNEPQQEISNGNNELIQINTPTYPESITEGDMRWHKNIGDGVSLDEVIGEIETDKTTIEVMSPCDGILTKLLIQTGEKAPVNSTLASIRPIISQQQNAESNVSSSTIKQIDSSTSKKPSLKMKENLVDEKKSLRSLSSTDNTINLEKNDRETTRVKMTRIRQTISKRLKHAQNSCAMLTTFNEVDMSNLIEMRTTYKDSFAKKHNIKLGFMSAFIKSSSYALQQLPIVNAYVDNDEIVYHNYVDISVAVASAKGLVVPVIRDVQKLDFADIEKILSNYADDAKSGKLKAEDMDGGTFTISNGGVFGSLMGTPIINPPQSAILGMHAINERPVVVDGNIVIRPMMYLALTYDHRLIDGREAVTFLKKIKQSIEDPRTMLLSL